MTARNPHALSAARLLAWSDRATSREPRHALRWLARGALTAGLVALVAWRQWDAGDVAALATWHQVTIALSGVLMIRVALALFWRADTATLSRLPIDGVVLFDVALIRAVRTSAIFVATGLLALLPIAITSTIPALRAVALTLALGVIAATLLPAAATAAAAMVATGQAVALVDALGGEFRPPATTILGTLPGVATTLVMALGIAMGAWLPAGGATVLGPNAPWMLGGAGAVGILALIAMRSRAHGLAVALREVAALDRQRLAHIEIHPPTAIERITIAVAGAASATSLSKDARLMRRRYPLAWVIGLALWVVAIVLAATVPSAADGWALGLAIAGGVYAVTLAHRLAMAPIELPRLTAALPQLATAVVRGKRAWLTSWMLIFVSPAVVVATVRAPHTQVLALAAAVTVLAGWLVAQRSVARG